MSSGEHATDTGAGEKVEEDDVTGSKLYPCLTSTLHTVERHLIMHMLDLKTFSHIAVTCSQIYMEAQAPFAVKNQRLIEVTHPWVSRLLLSALKTSPLLRNVFCSLNINGKCQSGCKCCGCWSLNSCRVRSLWIRNGKPDEEILPYLFSANQNCPGLAFVEELGFVGNELFPLSCLQTMHRLRLLNVQVESYLQLSDCSRSPSQDSSSSQASSSSQVSLPFLHEVDLSLKLSKHDALTKQTSCVWQLVRFLNASSNQSMTSLKLPPLNSYVQLSSFHQLKQLVLRGVFLQFHKSEIAPALLSLTQLQNIVFDGVRSENLLDMFNILIQLSYLEKIEVRVVGNKLAVVDSSNADIDRIPLVCPMLARAQSLSCVKIRVCGHTMMLDFRSRYDHLILKHLLERMDKQVIVNQKQQRVLYSLSISH